MAAPQTVQSNAFCRRRLLLLLAAAAFATAGAIINRACVAEQQGIATALSGWQLKEERRGQSDIEEPSKLTYEHLHGPNPIRFGRGELFYRGLHARY